MWRALGLLVSSVMFGQLNDMAVHVTAKALLPELCNVGDTYFVVDAQPSRNLYFCTWMHTYVQMPGVFQLKTPTGDILCANASDTGCAGHVATSETPYETTMLLPKKFFRAGKIARIHVGLSYTTGAGNPNQTLYVSLGGTKVYESDAGQLKTSAGNRGLQFQLTCSAENEPRALVPVICLPTTPAAAQTANVIAQPVNLNTLGELLITVATKYTVGTAGNWMYLTRLWVFEEN